jgi:hypothetical protein
MGIITKNNKNNKKQQKQQKITKTTKSFFIVMFDTMDIFEVCLPLS